MFAWLWACTPTPIPAPREVADTASTGETAIADTAPDGHSASPAHTGRPDDCVGSPSVLGRHDLLVFEDFEFLPDGRLATGANNFLMVYTDWGGEMTQLGVGLGENPTGLRVLATGEIAVADVREGTVSLVYENGAVSALLGGLSNPNGLAAARDGTFYVSEHVPGGRVVHVDPATEAVEVVWTADGDRAPNGLALSRDDRNLFVALGTRVERIPLAGGEVETVHDFGSGELDSVAIDVCGSVYTIDYGGGALYRLDTTGGVEELLELNDTGFLSGMRWGNGTAGLPRDHLFVSSQHQGVTELVIGVDGVAFPYAR